MSYLPCGRRRAEPTAAVSAEHYDKTFDINTRGVFFAVQKALPLMNDGGSIILTGSGVWQRGIPIYPTYGATKAALRSFVRTWTADFAAKEIRANMLSPGPTDTPLAQANADLWLSFAQDYRDATGCNVHTPDEMASAMVFLNSDAARAISGVNLLVDNGHAMSSVTGSFAPGKPILDLIMGKVSLG